MNLVLLLYTVTVQCTYIVVGASHSEHWGGLSEPIAVEQIQSHGLPMSQPTTKAAQM